MQPDSIIPDIYDPLDLDRYQYVHSNPINFNDPTGHKNCSIDDDACIHHTSVRNILIAKYGITVNGAKPKDMLTFLDAAKNQDAVLHGIKRAFGNITFNMTYDESGGYGGNYLYDKLNSTINFHGSYEGLLPDENVIHEMGHMVAWELLDEDPHTDLDSHSYYTPDGEFVMGRQYGQYNRQPGLGYLNPCPAGVNGCSSEQHTIYFNPGGDNPGNSPDEEWADMYLSYSTDQIDLASPAGKVRYNFVARFLRQVQGVSRNP